MTKGIGPELTDDERLDILFFMRIISGVAIGSVAGLLGLEGYPVIAVFAGVSIWGSLLYV